MSFISKLKTVGEDILKGIETATKVPGVTTIPFAGPILTEIGTVLGNIETSAANANSNVTQIEQEIVSAIVQTTAQLQTLKQHATATVTGSATTSSAAAAPPAA